MRFDSAWLTLSLTLGQQCSYNENYSTLKNEWYGVVVTLEGLVCDAGCWGLPSPFDCTAWLCFGAGLSVVRDRDPRRDSQDNFQGVQATP